MIVRRPRKWGEVEKRVPPSVFLPRPTFAESPATTERAHPLSGKDLREGFSYCALMNSRIEGQLTRVLNNPHDDSERALYAEMLREEDDPRGEFIALQLLRDPTRDQSNRIKDLTKTHAKRFLGPLDKIVVNQDREFTRGFLSKCIVRRDDVFDLVRHPATATIEDIRVLPRRRGTVEYELSTPKRALDLGPLTEFVSLRKLEICAARM